jgi:hypothetical protein
MNFLNILNEIEKTDPEVYERLSPRRKAMKEFLNIGSKVALSALPLAVGSVFNKAYGQNTTSIISVLNFALTLEYLEAEFYTLGVNRTGLIPAAEVASFTLIRNDENNHVNFLRTTITALGGTPVAKPTFDFTAKGTFADVFTNFTTYAALAQAFEDTGVRAYKGQAGNVMSSDTVLSAALRIHSVEARHAAHIRKVRMEAGVAVKPWITLNQSGIASPAVVGIYAGEEATSQANVQITGIGGTSVSANAASEAFDEPLTREQVLEIVKPFLV